MQAFAREKELCALLRDAEAAHRCVRSHRPVPAACGERTAHSLEALLPLVAQQAVLLEQAATAGTGGAARRERAAEDAADFHLFADDSSSLCASTTLLLVLPPLGLHRFDLFVRVTNCLPRKKGKSEKDKVNCTFVWWPVCGLQQLVRFHYPSVCLLTAEMKGAGKFPKSTPLQVVL